MYKGSLINFVLSLIGISSHFGNEYCGCSGLVCLTNLHLLGLEASMSSFDKLK